MMTNTANEAMKNMDSVDPNLSVSIDYKQSADSGSAHVRVGSRGAE
jgi:hypothetical protein